MDITLLWFVIMRMRGNRNSVLFYTKNDEKCSTGKSILEALIFASTNPQYDKRLFIELQVQYMKITSSEHRRTCCVHKLFFVFVLSLQFSCAELVIQ